MAANINPSVQIYGGTSYIVLSRDEYDYLQQELHKYRNAFKLRQRWNDELELVVDKDVAYNMAGSLLQEHKHCGQYEMLDDEKFDAPCATIAHKLDTEE